MSNARTHVGVEVGDGLVARFGDVLVLVAEPGRHAQGTEGLLDAVESTASGGESPGAAVAFRLARIFAGPDLAAVPPFGVVAPTEDGYVVLLHGSVWAEITGPGGTERLAGAAAVTWVDRIIKAPVERLTMGSGDHPVAVDPRSDLRAGLVPGSGFILTSAGSTGAVDAPAGSWAGELQGGAAPAPVAGSATGAGGQEDQSHRDHRATAPAQAEAVAAVAEAAWALVEEAAPQSVDPEPHEPQAVEPETADPEAADPDPIAPDPVEAGVAGTVLDAPTAAEPPLARWDDEGGSTEAEPEGAGADVAEPGTADAAAVASEASEASEAEVAGPEAVEPEAPEPASPQPVVAAGPWSVQSQSGQAASTAPTSSEPGPGAASYQAPEAETAPAVAEIAPAEAASFAQPVDAAAAAAPAAAGSAWDQPTTAQPMRGDPAAAGGQFKWGADAAPAADSSQVGSAPAQTGAWVVASLVGTDGARLPLDRSYVLGREPEHDPAVLSGAATPVRLPDDENLISRVQSYITVDGGQVSLRDAASANGTYVAAPGAPTWTRLGPDPVLLPPTWSLRVGNRVFTYVAGAYAS